MFNVGQNVNPSTRASASLGDSEREIPTTDAPTFAVSPLACTLLGSILVCLETVLGLAVAPAMECTLLIGMLFLPYRFWCRPIFH